jgi:hypothetical protein
MKLLGQVIVRLVQAAVVAAILAGAVYVTLPPVMHP